MIEILFEIWFEIDTGTSDIYSIGQLFQWRWFHGDENRQAIDRCAISNIGAPWNMPLKPTSWNHSLSLMTKFKGGLLERKSTIGQVGYKLRTAT